MLEEYIAHIWKAVRMSGKVLGVIDLMNDIETYLLKGTADNEVLGYLNDNFPDFQKLRDGDVTSLTAQVVQYKYKTGDLDENGAPVVATGVIFRHVGAGTSIQSAVDHKVYDDETFFTDAETAADIKALTGRDATVHRQLLVEVEWDNAQGGFASTKYEDDVKGAVATAQRRRAALSKVDQLPTMPGRLATLAKAQSTYEAAVSSSLDAASRAKLQAQLAKKNAVLGELKAAVRSYEEYRAEVARQQALMVLGYLTQFASIANAAIDRENSAAQWQELMDRFSRVESGLSALEAEMGNVSNQLSHLGVAVSNTYTMLGWLADYHADVFAPPPFKPFDPVRIHGQRRPN